MVKYKSSKILFNMQQNLFILLHLQIIFVFIIYYIIMNINICYIHENEWKKLLKKYIKICYDLKKNYVHSNNSIN